MRMRLNQLLELLPPRLISRSNVTELKMRIAAAFLPYQHVSFGCIGQLQPYRGVLVRFGSLGAQQSRLRALTVDFG